MSEELVYQELENFSSDQAALLAAGAALGQPRTHSTPDARPYALVPDGYTVLELPRAHVPERPRAIVRLRDAASFVRYFNDHKTDYSRIFAGRDPALFLAVFDEFSAVTPGDAGVWPQADWREFRAAFSVPPSREWLLWHAANRKPMSQVSFAEFLQDNLPDVVQPAGADLLELALNFEAAQSGTYVAAQSGTYVATQSGTYVATQSGTYVATQSGTYVATQRLKDGSHNLQWRADNNASGTVKLPEHITLMIPVFENEAPSELQARLKYRVKEGNLSLWFELVRPHKVLEAAFRSAWERIAEGTGAVILLGSPE